MFFYFGLLTFARSFFGEHSSTMRLSTPTRMRRGLSHGVELVAGPGGSQLAGRLRVVAEILPQGLRTKRYASRCCDPSNSPSRLLISSADSVRFDK